MKILASTNPETLANLFIEAFSENLKSLENRDTIVI
jgi:hypothetical protein